VTTACTATPVAIPDKEGLISNPTTSYRVWQSADLRNYNYFYTVAGYPFETSEVRVKVRKGEVHSTVYAHDGIDASHQDEIRKGQNAQKRYPSMGRTIEDIFEHVRSCTGDCYVRRELYHPDLGFPVLIELESKELADGWAVFRVKRLEVTDW